MDKITKIKTIIGIIMFIILFVVLFLIIFDELDYKAKLIKAGLTILICVYILIASYLITSYSRLEEKKEEIKKTKSDEN